MAAGSISITVEVPASLADEQTAERARVLLVLDAVRSERLSWRAAARELRLSASQFLDLARIHGIPVVRYDRADFEQDVRTLDALASRNDSAG